MMEQASWRASRAWKAWRACRRLRCISNVCSLPAPFSGRTGQHPSAPSNASGLRPPRGCDCGWEAARPKSFRLAKRLEFCRNRAKVRRHRPNSCPSRGRLRTRKCARSCAKRLLKCGPPGTPHTHPVQGDLSRRHIPVASDNARGFSRGRQDFPGGLRRGASAPPLRLRVGCTARKAKSNTMWSASNTHHRTSATVNQ